MHGELLASISPRPRILTGMSRCLARHRDLRWLSPIVGAVVKAKPRGRRGSRRLRVRPEHLERHRHLLVGPRSLRIRMWSGSRRPRSGRATWRRRASPALVAAPGGLAMAGAMAAAHALRSRWSRARGFRQCRPMFSGCDLLIRRASCSLTTSPPRQRDGARHGPCRASDRNPAPATVLPMPRRPIDPQRVTLAAVGAVGRLDLGDDERLVRT